MNRHQISKAYSNVENKKIRKWFWTLDSGGTEDISKGLSDIQGLITRGYKTLHYASYMLLRINDNNKAKEYFKSLIPHITTGKRNLPSNNQNNDPSEAINIAFTSEGLLRLGIPDNIIKTFSREFVEGMTGIDSPNQINERTTLLGDTGQNSPTKWSWGFGDTNVHCVLMLYAKTDRDLNLLKDKILPKDLGGFTTVYEGKTLYQNNKFPKEHFGFNDGISQPIIKGLSKSGNIKDEKNEINPGEIILGYKNEYDGFSPSPYVEDDFESSYLDYLPGYSDKKDLGKNGSYLVFRQIEQHVENFWKYNYQESKESGLTSEEKAIRLASKMIGRFPDGTPLMINKDNENDITQNNFGYRDSDSFGLKCPFGAHIRRTNPRDQAHACRSKQESIEISKKHSMLRRGRLYGEPFDEGFEVSKMLEKIKQEIKCSEAGSNYKQEPAANSKDGKSIVNRGLFFICLVSDISRQFEFVQSAWANTSTFGDLCNEVDPLISPRPGHDQPHCHEFTTPQKRIRNRYRNMPQFTTVVGGAYFFMPGIRTLHYLLQKCS